jgi:hypothetical protein
MEKQGNYTLEEIKEPVLLEAGKRGHSASG